MDGFPEEVVFATAHGPGVGAHEGDARPSTPGGCEFARQFLALRALKRHIGEDEPGVAGPGKGAGFAQARTGIAAKTGAFEHQP